MYYEDGTKAAIGDIVLGPSDNRQGTIVGMVSSVKSLEVNMVHVRILATVVTDVISGTRRVSIYQGDTDFASAAELRKIL